jgi:hypothetical protein
MDGYDDLLPVMRQQRLERCGVYPLHSEEDALRFLDDVGICRFSHHGDVDLPCFSDALAEEVRDETWGWKDSLPNTRKIYYGTLFHFHERDAVRPGFLALRLLAACYTLSPVMQFGGDPSMLPRWTGLSLEALNLAVTLERDGSLPTSALRLATGLNGKAHNTLFNKALIEAQRNFLIVRTGVTSTSRANYGYIWEFFPRAYPAIVSAAENLVEEEAAERIIAQYVDTAVVATVQRIANVLTLDLALLQRAAGRLVEKGTLSQDSAGRLVISNSLGRRC